MCGLLQRLEASRRSLGECAIVRRMMQSVSPKTLSAGLATGASSTSHAHLAMCGSTLGMAASGVWPEVRGELRGHSLHARAHTVGACSVRVRDCVCPGVHDLVALARCFFASHVHMGM